MKKLILLSDQIMNKTEKIDNEIVKILNKSNPKIAYIPSVSDKSRKYYNLKKEYYNKLGINNIIYFDLDEEYDECNIEELFKCDAIHLSGGDTSNFQKNIKIRNIDKVLYEFLEKGGILIGISAGAILMSQDIDIALIGEETKYPVTHTRGLGLVDFDIMPHWGRNDYSLEDLISYSKIKKRMVYLCKDGDGIIVDDNKVRIIGDVIQILNGEVLNI